MIKSGDYPNLILFSLTEFNNLPWNVIPRQAESKMLITVY